MRARGLENGVVGTAPDQVVAALSGGAAQSWVLANRSGRMLANDYPLGFKVSLHLKDLGIALALARESGAVLPVAALAAQLEAHQLALVLAHVGVGRPGLIQRGTIVRWLLERRSVRVVGREEVLERQAHASS